MPPNEYRLSWVNILFLSGTLLMAVIATPWYLAVQGWHWGLFAFFLVTALATNLSITAGYHRFLSHRSYDAKPLVKLIYLLIASAAFQGSALQWCADHRRHHRFVDTERDPHNINKGFWWAHVGWLLVKEPPDKQSPFPPDLLRDRMVMWQHRHFVAIGTTVGFILPLAVGWLFGHPFGGLLFGGVLRVCVTNHCTFFINSLAHYVGTKPYSPDATARDSVIMAILACGEGYHNFHHEFAADYRNGIRWYHWDPTKWMIWSLSIPGWTYKLRQVSSTEILKARLSAEQPQLIAKGLPPDRVQALKLKIEEAQKRWRTLCDDYRALKRSFESSSRARMLQLKQDARAARLELKYARAQWGSWKKQPVRVYSRT